MRFKMILLAAILSGLTAIGALLQSQNPEPLTPVLLAAAEKIIGLQFNEAKRDSMLGDLRGRLKSHLLVNKKLAFFMFVPRFNKHEKKTLPQRFK